jgi:ABC-type uncharacterized transport system auxiliary subunit
MKRKLLLVGALGLTAVLAACHDNSNNNPPATQSTPPPPPPAPLSLDTAQVLVVAQQTSETAAPLAVNGGALTLNDTSETSAPIPVNTN